MIVAVSRIPLPKTERYLYWVRVARSAVVHDTMGYRTFLFFCRRSPYIKQFSEYGGAKVLNARIFYFTEDELLIFALHPLMGKIKK